MYIVLVIHIEFSIFYLQLDKVEAQERLDAAVGNVKPVKGVKKLGRGGREAIAKNETCPSPMGRRVVPKVDPDRIKKLERAIISKENKGKRVSTLLIFPFVFTCGKDRLHKL